MTTKCEHARQQATIAELMSENNAICNENYELREAARAVVEDAYDNHGILETRFAAIRQEIIDALAALLEKNDE